MATNKNIVTSSLLFSKVQSGFCFEWDALYFYFKKSSLHTCSFEWLYVVFSHENLEVSDKINKI